MLSLILDAMFTLSKTTSLQKRFHTFLAYELLRRTPGLKAHTAFGALISAVWTLGCRYSFRFGHWDVVAYISSREPATTSQCLTRNE